jgi:hypothetical protein
MDRLLLCIEDMNKLWYRFIFTLCFGFICSLLCIVLMERGTPQVGKYVGGINFAAFYLWLLSMKISSFGGFWSYYVMVFVQWLLVGFAVSFLIRTKATGNGT